MKLQEIEKIVNAGRGEGVIVERIAKPHKAGNWIAWEIKTTFWGLTRKVNALRARGLEVVVDDRLLRVRDDQVEFDPKELFVFEQHGFTHSLIERYHKGDN